MKNSKRLLALAVSAALAAPMAAYATNGMNLEAYGPIAAGMGGASMAYDNGTAAVMNNPATLGLMEEGNRLDVAVGFLRPTVTTDMGAMSWDSSATSFMMPAVGWVQKSGANSYGVGMMAQGGMGATYDGDTSPGGVMSSGEATANVGVLDGMATGFGLTHVSIAEKMGGTTTNAQIAAGIGDTVAALEEMSELGVARLIFPFARNINDKLTLAGSIDYVQAGLDLRMAMAGSMMQDMMNPSSTTAPGSISGGLVGPTGMGGMFFDPLNPNMWDTVNPMNSSFGITGMNYGYFDFADSDPMRGEARGAGFAGKIGMTFKANNKLTIGATYHSKTSMSDLKADNAKVSMSVLMSSVDGTTGELITMPADIVMNGDIAVQDFQWPSTMALGVSFQATDKLMIVADVKKINWSDVMANFTMQFDAKSISMTTAMGTMDATAMFADKDMTAVLYQNWEDQTVIQLGAAYQVTNAATVRVGYNSSSNPVPDETMNYLFPAISEKAYTLGLGYSISDKSSVDFAYNNVQSSTGGLDTRFTTTMSQNNYQMMYSYKF